MKKDKKRIYVGNLPFDVSETDIIKRFRSFGNVQSVEVKHRPDSSAFAFLDLETDEENLNLCFSTLLKKKWNGNVIKLQLAKESFLSRLEKERKGTQSERQELGREQNKHDNFVTRKHKEVSSKEIYKSAKDEKLRVIDSDGSSGAQVVYNGKLRMFGGTGNIFSDLEEVNHGKMCESEGAATDLLQRLEKFSNVWKDLPEKCDLIKIKTDKIEIENEKLGKLEITNKFEKLEKSLLAEEKRKKSVEERRKSFQKQKQTIKLALSSTDSGHKNKKIVFDSEDESNNTKKRVSFGEANFSLESEIVDESTHKPNLFEGSSSGEESEAENNFKIKPQFEGSKGQKLLELQSRFGNDSRFAMDERFYESDEENEEVHMETLNVDDERKRQFEILENILGHKIPVTEKKKEKIKHTPMIRYDPTNPDHAKFETKIEPNVKNRKVTHLSSDNEREKLHSETNKNDIQTTVSKETFYKVTDTLKETLKKRNENTEEFSLRKLFGNTGKEDGSEEEETYTTKHLSKPEWTTDPFRCESFESEQPIEQNQPQSQFSERFFFIKDDPCFQEGLDWIRGSQSKDESFDYAKHRRELKRLVRAKVKNNRRNNRPWRRKVGGQKMKKFNKRRKNN
ncbi:probable RNA-binding protein CG14230 isoform X2 [Periplaneta americana]